MGPSSPCPGPRQRPLLVVLSGPSGVGKDAVLNRLKKSAFPLRYITTVTTRAKRPAETDGVDYHFVSEAEFRAMIERNQLLEWANVYGHLYGVPRTPVEQALGGGNDVMVKVDVQGAASIKKLMSQAVFIFLKAPSEEELLQRLKQRKTESPSELAVRTGVAEEESRQQATFDYVVVSKQGKIDEAVKEIQDIIRKEKCRSPSERGA